jgi:hypothetical protein
VEFNKKENNLKTLMMYRILAGVYEMRQNLFHGASQVIIFKKRKKNSNSFHDIIHVWLRHFFDGPVKKTKDKLRLRDGNGLITKTAHAIGGEEE